MLLARRAPPLIVSDVELMLRAALDGVGLAFELEEHVAEHIARRRHQPAALQALVDALRV